MKTTGHAGLKQPPFWVVSVLIYVVAVSSMAYVRLVLFPVRFIALAYGLPLLVCLWQRDRVLLWALTVSLIGMSTCKTFFLLPKMEGFHSHSGAYS
jgi:hypothetical protein